VTGAQEDQMPVSAGDPMGAAPGQQAVPHLRAGPHGIVAAAEHQQRRVDPLIRDRRPRGRLGIAQPVQPAAAVHRRRHEGLDRRLVGHIGLDERHLAAGGAGRRLGGTTAVDVDVTPDDRGAFGGEGLGQDPAVAASRPR
jgi:hypothetical protein